MSKYFLFILTKIYHFLFTISSSQKDPDPGSGFGSGSKILDFQFEDPDQKLLISDPKHCSVLKQKNKNEVTGVRPTTSSWFNTGQNDL